MARPQGASEPAWYDELLRNVPSPTRARQQAEEEEKQRQWLADYTDRMSDLVGDASLVGDDERRSRDHRAQLKAEADNWSRLAGQAAVRGDLSALGPDGPGLKAHKLRSELSSFEFLENMAASRRQTAEHEREQAARTADWEDHSAQMQSNFAAESQARLKRDAAAREQLQRAQDAKRQELMSSFMAPRKQRGSWP